MLDADFSRVNLHYLICARDLARQAPERVPLLLGVPDALGRLLAAVTPEELSAVTGIKAPLLVPRQEPWWWQRLLRAMRDGRGEEVQAILEHAGLLVADR